MRALFLRRLALGPWGSLVYPWWFGTTRLRFKSGRTHSNPVLPSLRQLASAEKRFGGNQSDQEVPQLVGGQVRDGELKEIIEIVRGEDGNTFPNRIAAGRCHHNAAGPAHYEDRHGFEVRNR